MKRALLTAGLAAVGLAGFPRADAQTVESYFPPGSGGYDKQLGVTVQTRARPLYDTPGVRLGGFLIHPDIDEYLLYNSSLNGASASGSWGAHTSGSVSAASDWSRNGIGAYAGFDNYRYFSIPSDTYTDWTVGLGGGYVIGDDVLAGAYTHQSYHQLGISLGTFASDRPVLNQTDSARVSYTVNLNRLSITPDFSATAYRFGTATVDGVSLNQNFLDRDVLAGGFTARYSLSDVGSLVGVVRAVSADYVNPLPGFPSNNSTSILALGGVDYQTRGIWRYQVLVGVENRMFEASQYPSRTALIAQANVIWTPTGLTTVTATISRTIEDPETAGINGYFLTQPKLVVDHELMRNVLLQGRVGLQYVQYLPHGTQSGFTLGAGVAWLLNRNMRATLDYDFTRQTSASNAPAQLMSQPLTGGHFSQHLISIALHFGL